MHDFRDFLANLKEPQQSLFAKKYLNLITLFVSNNEKERTWNVERW
jgi:hypothetical protein